MAIERKFSSKDVHKIQDLETREFLYKVSRFIETSTQNASELHFKTLDFDSAGVKKIKHGLGYKPTDAYTTAVSNGATATFNYGNFTDTDLELTVSAPCTVRFVFGEHKET